MYAGIIVTIIGIWFLVIFTPYVENKKSLNAKITADHIKLSDFEQTIHILPKYLTELKSLKEQRSSLNSKLYTKEEVINLFERLKKTANSQHLEVTEITPPIAELLHLNSMIPDSTNPQFLNIGVRVSGSYIEFAKFIKIIEKESFFRGVNACRILGSKDYNKELDLYIGFKALLGHTGDQS